MDFFIWESTPGSALRLLLAHLAGSADHIGYRELNLDRLHARQMPFRLCYCSDPHSHGFLRVETSIFLIYFTTSPLNLLPTILRGAGQIHVNIYARFIVSQESIMILPVSQSTSPTSHQDREPICFSIGAWTILFSAPGLRCL